MLRVYIPPTISRLERETHAFFFNLFIYVLKSDARQNLFYSYPKEENALLRSVSLFLFCQLSISFFI